MKFKLQAQGVDSLVADTSQTPQWRPNQYL